MGKIVLFEKMVFLGKHNKFFGIIFFGWARECVSDDRFFQTSAKFFFPFGKLGVSIRNVLGKCFFFGEWVKVSVPGELRNKP